MRWQRGGSTRGMHATAPRPRRNNRKRKEPICTAVKARKPVARREYLTFTGLSELAGPRLTSDFATPSTTRPGHERGSAHVFRERASPDGGTQGGSRAIGGDHCGARCATVGLVRGQWVGTRIICVRVGANPTQRALPTPAAKRARLRRRHVLDPSSSQDSLEADESAAKHPQKRHGAEHGGPCKDLMLDTWHHGSHRLVGTDGGTNDVGPRRVVVASPHAE